MKVQIKDLKPNPFRDIEHYPIDRIKVESLISSIRTTGFWDNIIGRQANGDIQIAYGHHRLEALKQVFKPIDEVDIPVKDLDDSTMIRIMANENMEQWGNNLAIIIETVRVVKDYLNAELSKYDTWEEIRQSHLMNLLDGSRKEDFLRLKSKGVGQTIILEFLGPPWKQHMIQKALDLIKDKEFDEESAKVFKSISRAQYFKKAVEDINKSEPGKILFNDQLNIASRVAQRLESKETSTGSDPSIIASGMKSIVLQEVEGTDEFDSTLKDLEIDLERIENETRRLTSLILSMNGRLHEMGVEQFQSMKVVFAVQEFSNLQLATKVLAEYFGYKRKQIEND